MLPVPLNVTAVVVALLHSVWLETAVTEGVGLTVIIKFCGVPAQPFAVGVTVIVAVTAALVLLVAVNAAILPEPLAARPIEVVLFVQLNVVPVTEPVRATAVVLVLLHKV